MHIQRSDLTIRYDTIQYDDIYVCPKANTQPAKSAARNQTKKNNEETKNKNRDAQKKRSSHKAVESVLRPEGSLWWERFVKKPYDL